MKKDCPASPRKKDSPASLPPNKHYQYEIVPHDTELMSCIGHSRACILDGRGQLASLNQKGNHVSIKDLERILATGDQHIQNGISQCYKNTGLSKVHAIVTALKVFLANKKNGKLCIFSNHTAVLDKIADGVGLTTLNSI